MFSSSSGSKVHLSQCESRGVDYGSVETEDTNNESTRKRSSRTLVLCTLFLLLLAALAIVGAVYATSFRTSPRASMKKINKKNDYGRSTSEIRTYRSRYMNATNTTLVALENGAMVGLDTVAYFNLSVNSKKRASYDSNIVKKVADGIWCIGSSSIINVNVVEGIGGLILLDTGDTYDEGENFYRLLRTVTQKPIRAIIYTHEHPVHGAQAFVDGDRETLNNTDIMIIGNPNINESVFRTGGLATPYPEVASVLIGRSMEQTNVYLPAEGPDAGFKNTVKLGEQAFVPVNTPVENGQFMIVAGLRLQFFTQGITTDSANQLLVWIPSRKIIMNNILWGWFPNLYSARGGKFRDPTAWIEAVDFARSLNPEIVLGTHSVPVVGANKVKRKLLKYRDGIAYIRDQTLKGILLGQTGDELPYSVELPEQFLDEPNLVENYGEISVMIPRIFEATFGTFNRNAAKLNKLHPNEEADRMVLAMGGEEETRAKAEQAFEDGDYLWSCQIADYLVKANDVEENRQIKANCLREMGYRTLSTNSRSWYLSQALALEGSAKILQKMWATIESIEMNTADYVSHYRVRINGHRSRFVNQLLGVQFPDRPLYGLHIRNGVVEFIPDVEKYDDRRVAVTVQVTPQIWAEIYNNRKDPGELIDNGNITVTQGALSNGKFLFGLFDAVYDLPGGV